MIVRLAETAELLMDEPSSDEVPLEEYKNSPNVWCNITMEQGIGLTDVQADHSNPVKNDRPFNGN